MIVAAAAAFALLGPQLTRLPNGIPVIVDAGGKDSVTIQVLVRTDDLSPEELGAVETISGAILGETENYSLRELRRLAWAAGGAIVCESAGDCLRMEIVTTRERLRPTAAFVSDTLRKPAFTPESLEQARAANARFQDWLDRTPPLRAVRTDAARRGFGPLPVTAISSEQARSLHAKVFRPERVSIAVVGDVSADDVAEIFGASIGHWRAEAASRAPAFRSAPPREPQGFSTSLATVKGPVPTTQGFAAWMVACIAFGEGKQSTLNRKYRVEAGASYVLGSYFTFRENTSYCTFYVSSSGRPPADLTATVAAFAPTAPDIKRAKSYLPGRYRVGGPTEVGRTCAFAVGHESDSARAFWLAWWEMKGAGMGRDAAFIEPVALVSDEAVIGATKDWLVP